MADAVNAAVVIDGIIDLKGSINEQQLWTSALSEGTVFHSLPAHPPLLWLMLIWSFQYASERKQRLKSGLPVIWYLKQQRCCAEWVFLLGGECF